MDGLTALRTTVADLFDEAHETGERDPILVACDLIEETGMLSLANHWREFMNPSQASNWARLLRNIEPIGYVADPGEDLAAEEFNEWFQADKAGVANG